MEKEELNRKLATAFFPASGCLDTTIAKFKDEVYDRAEEIDPGSGQDWFSMTLGWAIAKGMEPELAHAFATYIRYDTELRIRFFDE